MMRSIVLGSLRFRRLVLAAAAGVLLLGVLQLRGASIDTYPEFAPVTVQIQTEALGLSATEVEQLVTVPLEQDLLNGVAWLDTISSDSQPGLSSIELVFEPGTDVLKARQAVQERLSQAHALPAVGSAPIMIQPVAATSRVQMVGLSSRQLSLIDMSVLARWKIRPKLMGIPGVANVAIWGQRDRQLQVQVDPDQLRRRGVSLSQVIDSTGNALWVSSLNFLEASTPGTGGFVDTPNQRFAVQHILPITTPQALAAVTLDDVQGRHLRLGDVAHVVEDHQPLIGDAVRPDGNALILVVQKFPEADTLAVSRAVEGALRSLAPGLAGVQIDTGLYRPATFLDSAVGHLGRAGVLGLLLAALVLCVLLLSWRAALVHLLSLGLAAVAAVYVLSLRGAPLNAMVLAGLVAALAVLVDDVVFVVAQVRRRLRDAASAGDTTPSHQLLARAVTAASGPTVYATLILLLAVAPVVLLRGVAGALSRPLVVSYAVAIVVSSVVALTVTPALSALLLDKAGRGHGRSRVARWGSEKAGGGIAAWAARPRRAYTTVAVLAVVGLLALGPGLVRSNSVLPTLQDRGLLIHLRTASGTSLAEMDRITQAAAHELRAVPGVRDVGAHVGRAIASDQVVDVNSGEMWVDVAPGADYAATRSAVADVVAGYPGLRTDVTTYAADQLRQARGATTAPLVVRLYGIDLTELNATAQRVRQMLASVPGVRDPRVQAQPRQPSLDVHVDLAKAERHGLKPGDVRRSAATLLSGLQVGSLYEDQKVFDVVVWGMPAVRHSAASVENLLIDTPEGGYVRLRDVADVTVRPIVPAIHHDATARSLDVTAGVAGSAVAVADDVRARLQHLAMPLEYHAEVLAPQGWRQDVGRLLPFGLAALLGIYLLLQAAFSSWRLPLLVFAVLPLAAVGGLVVAPFTGGLATLAGGLGLLAVLGLTLRHLVLLITRYRETTGPGAAPDVVQVTRDTAGPILLGALTTAAVLLPTALYGRMAGLELLQPFAVVMLGGLITSTGVVLLVLPALFLRWGPRAADESVPAVPAAPAQRQEMTARPSGRIG
jgi:Cu/Ag efflux pump CusA